MFRKEKKQLSYSSQKIADLYLKALANGEDIFLDAFTENNNIYSSIENLHEVRVILERGEYVKKEAGFSVFTYNPPGTHFQDISGEVTNIPQYTITDKGRRFIQAGQEFDVEGKKAKEAKKEKNKERLISALISFSTALLTIFIKWYFFDRK